MEKQGIYLGPRLRRLRRDMGITQSAMAADLEISPSYIALMERNQRPVTAEILLKLSRAYKIDFSTFADNSTVDIVARLKAITRDPILADLDIGPLEVEDVAHSFPGIAEAILRLHTAYREGQFVLADQRQERGVGGLEVASDPVAQVQAFLSARRNCFPLLDAASEALATRVADAGGFASYFKDRHQIRIRRMPTDVMVGSLRRLDWHRRELLLDEALERSSENFQLAQQLAYLEFSKDIEATVEEGKFEGESSRRLLTRGLAAYCAAATTMPYAAFAKAVETKRYDIEALSRQFGTSFEQTAHRMTTLQRPGQERIPFFFIRVDQAGNVSKRLNATTFPFARHGGGCPLWTVHQAFRTPREIITQWLELPDGQKFFSVVRTVASGGGGFGRGTVLRAVALVCEAQHAERLVYARSEERKINPTPIGITCRLCHRTDCTSRSEPPIGRHLLADNYRRLETPFGFSDE